MERNVCEGTDDVHVEGDLRSGHSELCSAACMNSLSDMCSKLQECRVAFEELQ